MPSQFLLDSGILGTDLLGPVVIVEATASLGDFSPSASSLVTHEATASATLGTLEASARAADIISATAIAELGLLSANADTIPQTPTIEISGGGNPNFVQPYFPPKPTPEVVEVSTIVANASTALGSFNAQAMAEIAFSILEDDSEVLLLI
jgi:hypothetical protein